MGKENKSKLGLIIGILGVAAGIVLIFSDSWQIGIGGSLASAGLVYQGYRDLKKSDS